MTEEKYKCVICGNSCNGNCDGTIKNQVTVEEVVNKLNELLKKDNEAIRYLFENAYVVNKEVANIEGLTIKIKEDTFLLSILSLINSFFGLDKHGLPAIVEFFEIDNNETVKLTGFHNRLQNKQIIKNKIEERQNKIL